MSNKPYLAPNEVAELLMVSPVTVRQWAQKGMLDAMLTAGGHRRFKFEEVERFAKERGLTLFRPQNEKIRILVVDNNADFLGSVRELISSIDSEIQVKTASDGFSAGHLVHSFNPDIILLDLRLEGLDGVDVTRCIKETPSTRSIRVVAMTDFPGDSNVEAVMEAGAEACMTKPFGAETLAETLKLKEVEAA